MTFKWLFLFSSDKLTFSNDQETIWRSTDFHNKVAKDNSEEKPFCWSLIIYTKTPEAMKVLHIHLTLLYLRGGLWWKGGLACRRSTAIFTSENKSIQTLKITVTCKISFMCSGKMESPRHRGSKWKWVPTSTLENPKTSQNAKNGDELALREMWSKFLFEAGYKTIFLLLTSSLCNLKSM